LSFRVGRESRSALFAVGRSRRTPDDGSFRDRIDGGTHWHDVRRSRDTTRGHRTEHSRQRQPNVVLTTAYPTHGVPGRPIPPEGTDTLEYGNQRFAYPAE